MKQQFLLSYIMVSFTCSLQAAECSTLSKRLKNFLQGDRNIIPRPLYTQDRVLESDIQESQKLTLSLDESFPNPRITEFIQEQKKRLRLYINYLDKQIKKLDESLVNSYELRDSLKDFYQSARYNTFIFYEECIKLLKSIENKRQVLTRDKERASKELYNYHPLEHLPAELILKIALNTFPQWTLKYDFKNFLNYTIYSLCQENLKKMHPDLKTSCPINIIMSDTERKNSLFYKITS